MDSAQYATKIKVVNTFTDCLYFILQCPASTQSFIYNFAEAKRKHTNFSYGRWNLIVSFRLCLHSRLRKIHALIFVTVNCRYFNHTSVGKSSF